MNLAEDSYSEYVRCTVRPVHKLVVLSGTPYAGKSQILTTFFRSTESAGYVSVPRSTTRPRRAHEDPQPPYRFIDDTEFEHQRRANQFVLVERNFGFQYAISSADIRSILTANAPAIVVANARVGFPLFRSLVPKCLLLFLSPVRIDPDFHYDVDELRRIVEERRSKRDCSNGVEAILEYCASEIAALRAFPDTHIVWNPEGDFNLMYERVTTAIREHMAGG